MAKGTKSVGATKPQQPFSVNTSEKGVITWPTDFDVPEGYLTLSEFDAENPKYEQDLKYRRDRRVGVFFNEPCPVFAMIRSKREYMMISPGMEFTMMATDIFWLIGDPKYDLSKPAPPLNDPTKPALEGNFRVDPIQWQARRRTALDRVHRNPMYRIKNYKTVGTRRIPVMPYYRNWQDLWFQDEFKVWGKVPDVRILSTSRQLIEVAIPKLDLTDFVAAVMKQEGISFEIADPSPEEISKVQAYVVNNQDLYGLTSIMNLKQKDVKEISDGLITLAIKSACIKYRAQSESQVGKE